MLEAGLLRKSGQFDQALSVTGPLEAATEFTHAVAIGLILRRKGQYGESERALARAVEIKPEEVSGYLEAGDTCFEGQLWQNALSWYERALQLEAHQIWAEPSAWYCRWKLTGDTAWMTQVIDSATAGNGRANQLWFVAAGALPESGDATAATLRQIRDAWRKAPPATVNPGGTINIRLSTLEAPSNRLAVALEIASFGQNARLDVTVESIPDRDPREPVAAVDYLLWHYEDTDPVPALPPPPNDVAERIAALAAQPYDPEANWAQASYVAEALGVAEIETILAVMIHPPPVLDGSHALAWLPRAQLAAAQVLAWIDEGWDGSARRKALLSLLYGPFDWTTGAAIRVLARIAIEEKDYALQIHQCFEVLERHLPTQGHWDWVQILYQEWRTIPFLFDQERDEMKRKELAVSGQS